MRARARSVWASISRALLARLISWSRSNVVEPDVGLVVAGAVAGVPHQVVQLVLGQVELGAQPLAVGVELAAHLVELGLGPRLLVGLDRELPRGVAGGVFAAVFFTGAFFAGAFFAVDFLAGPCSLGPS